MRANMHSIGWGSILVLISMCLKDAFTMPYGGWGPKEGFGHTGNTFPPPNPNAIFGYDYFNLFDDWSTYGSVYNPHKNKTARLLPRHQRPKKHTSFAEPPQPSPIVTATSNGGAPNAIPDYKTDGKSEVNPSVNNLESRFQKIFKYFK